MSSSPKQQLIANIIELANVAFQSEYKAEAVSLLAHELDVQLKSIDDGYSESLTSAELDQMNIYLVAATKNLTYAAEVAAAEAKKTLEEQQAAVPVKVEKTGRVSITNSPAKDYSVKSDPDDIRR